MKKSLALLLSLMFVLTACGGSGAGTGTGTTGPSASDGTAPAAASGTAPGSGSGPAGTGGTDSGSADAASSGVQTSAEPSVPAPPPFEDVYRPVEGSDSLWELIPGGWEISADASPGCGGLFGDRLLLTYGVCPDDGGLDEYGEPLMEIEWHAVLVDLSRGSLIGDYTVDGDLFEAGFLDDGSVWLTCMVEPDGEGAPIGYDIFCFSDFPDGRQELRGVDFDAFSGVSPDGTVWEYDFTSRTLRGLTPFDDRPDTACAAPEWTSVCWLTRDKGNKSAFFAAYDPFGTPVTAGLDLESGTLTEYPRLRDVEWNAGCSMLSLNTSEHWTLAVPDDPGTLYTFKKLHEYNSVSASAGTRFAEYDYDEQTGKFSLTVYDAVTGTLLGRLDQPRGYTGIDCVGMDAEGRLYGIGYTGDGIRVLYWNYDAGKSRKAEDFRVLSTAEADDENARIADEIYEKYGIRVFYDRLSLDGLVQDYTCGYVDDGEKIRRALNIISKALAGYPKGIFEDMCAGQYGGIEFYLCGAFTPTDGSGIGSAAAITSTRFGSLIITAFNVNYPEVMEQNLAHELMHVMEHRLEAYCGEHDIPYEDQWGALNPDGFAYYESYHDEDGNEIYDASDTTWESGSGAYFVDPYSKSFATEDRARVFENLYMNNDGIFKSGHLRAKGKYLCDLIRKAFPSVGALDRAPWEILK